MYMYDTHMTCVGLLCVDLEDRVDIRKKFVFLLLVQCGRLSQSSLELADLCCDTQLAPDISSQPS